MAGSIAALSTTARHGCGVAGVRNGPGGMARLAACAALLLACTCASAAIVAEPGPRESAAAAPGFDTWRELGSREGLQQSTVYALAQDRDGYIWAGTEA